MVFGGSQVLMDLEPGVKLLAGLAPLHGPSHTLAGALLIGIVATLTGKPVSEFVLRLTGFKQYRISWPVAALSAFTGTFSHIGLDAIMHADMKPWSPITPSNGLLGLVSIESLHVICLVLLIVGAIGVWVRSRHARNV